MLLADGHNCLVTVLGNAWGELGRSEKQALRLVSMGAKTQVDELVRQLTLDVAPDVGSAAASTLLRKFSCLESLEVEGVSGAYIARLFTGSGVAFCELNARPSPSVKALKLRRCSEPNWAATMSPVTNSLTLLEMTDCAAKGPIFCALASCSKLRGISLMDVELDEEALSGLSTLTQVCDSNCTRST